MYKKSFLIFLLVISVWLPFTFFSCNHSKEDFSEEYLPEKVILPGLDIDKLRHLLFVKASDTLYKPEGIYDHRLGDTLKKFYISRNGKPVWLNYLQDSVFRHNLNTLLSLPEEHGLKSIFYNKSLIETGLNKFDALKSIQSDADYHLITDLDYLISHSVTGIYKDLSLGRINPEKFYKPFYSVPLSKGKNFQLFTVLRHPGHFYDSVLIKLPSSRRYRTLQLMYLRQRSFLERFKPSDPDTAQLPNSSANLEVVYHRMAMLWYALGEEMPEMNADFIKKNAEAYVSKTRRILGLPEGTLDSVLTHRLVVPVDEISDDLIASLERERWFAAPDTGVYIMVHLNDFMVYMQSDSTQNMKVCVGKSKPLNYAEQFKAYLKSRNYRLKPIDSETPQIGSFVNEVIINPTWTVPNSIIGKEMYAQIVSNPSYLTRKGYEVLKDGKVVSPSSINWKGFSPYGVTVKIRQKAGPSNSLGQLKFNFPNPHNIYMHDTPEKGKFSLRNRSVSHGCIRLNDPVRMAEFLLGFQGDSTLVDRFRLKMGLQAYDSALQVADSLLKPVKETEKIRLKKTIPIYLVYKTIWVERNGEIRMLKDIYRKNKSLAAALKK